MTLTSIQWIPDVNPANTAEEIFVLYLLSSSKEKKFGDHPLCGKYTKFTEK